MNMKCRNQVSFDSRFHCIVDFPDSICDCKFIGKENLCENYLGERKENNMSVIRCERCGKIVDIDNFSTIHDSNLCSKCAEKLRGKLKSETEQFIGEKHFRNAANELLAGLKEIGMELDEDNFKDTPARVARAYTEIFSGVTNTSEQVKEILSTAFPSDGANDMITCGGIISFSMCPHHLLPVEYRIAVGYVPNKSGKVLGLSKLVRLVEVLSKRPCLQEQLGVDIAKALESINPDGVAVIVNGRHMCMRMRGVKSPNSSVKTMTLRGCFKDVSSCRDEFIQNVKDSLEFN